MVELIISTECLMLMLPGFNLLNVLYVPGPKDCVGRVYAVEKATKWHEDGKGRANTKLVVTLKSVSEQIHVKKFEYFNITHICRCL